MTWVFVTLAWMAINLIGIAYFATLFLQLLNDDEDYL